MAQYGYRRDPDTGLYYCRARWYDPDAGQFLSPDPLNSLQTGKSNAYLYAGGNPVAHIDPEGRDYIASTQASQFGVRRDRVLWHVQQRNVTGRDRFTATIPIGDFDFSFNRVRLDPRFGGKLLNYYDIQDIAEGINGDLSGRPRDEQIQKIAGLLNQAFHGNIRNPEMPDRRPANPVYQPSLWDLLTESNPVLSAPSQALAWVSDQAEDLSTYLMNRGYNRLAVAAGAYSGAADAVSGILGIADVGAVVGNLEDQYNRYRGMGFSLYDTANLMLNPLLGLFEAYDARSYGAFDFGEELTGFERFERGAMSAAGVALTALGPIAAGRQLLYGATHGTRYIRAKAAFEVRRVRRYARKNGTNTYVDEYFDVDAGAYRALDDPYWEVNSQIRAFDPTTIRFKREWNIFRRHYRTYGGNTGIGGRFATREIGTLLRADPTQRRILFALPRNNAATKLAVTRIPTRPKQLVRHVVLQFRRPIVTGKVAAQPSKFTGLPEGVRTGGRSQTLFLDRAPGDQASIFYADWEDFLG